MSFQDNLLTEKSKNIGTIDYSATFKLFFTLQLTFVIVILSFIKPIHALLFSNLYANAYKITALLILGTLFTNYATFFGNFYLVAKNTTTLLTTSIIGSFLNILFTYAMTPVLGLYAAALGTMLSFAMICSVRYLYVKQIISIQLDYKYIIQLVSFLILVLCSVYVSNILFEIGCMFMSLGIFYFYNHLLIRQLII